MLLYMPNAKSASQMQSSIQERRVRLFRNGRNQAIRIPREFEFKGKEAIIRKEGERLIIEASKQPDLIEFLDGLKPMDEIIPDADEGLLPLDDVEL